MSQQRRSYLGGGLSAVAAPPTPHSPLPHTPAELCPTRAEIAAWPPALHRGCVPYLRFMCVTRLLDDDRLEDEAAEPPLADLPTNGGLLAVTSCTYAEVAFCHHG